MSTASDRVRIDFGNTDEQRDRGLKTPEDIVRYDNIVYGEDKEIQMLDVYRPLKDGDRLLPVIVSVHGGAWVYADKERYQFYCMNLAQRGFAVVNFTYRLAPENVFPACLEDTCLVFSWVQNHARKYGFDTRYVFGVGDSAGAHILGLFTAMCVDPCFAERFPFSVPHGFAPTALAMNCGVYYVSMSEQPEDILFTQLMEDFLPGKGTEEELRLINVLEHISGKFPPVYLMTAENDFVKKHTVALAEKLLEKNVSFAYYYYRDEHLDLGHVFHLNIRTKAAKLCNDETCSFFRRYVREEEQ